MRFHEISLQTKTDLYSALLNPDRVIELIHTAFEEDLQGGEDVTSVSTIPADHISTGKFRSRDVGVVAGIPIARAVLEFVGIGNISAEILCADRVEAGTVLMTARANTRALLLAERTALNFLGRLSGIATLTRRWVDEVADFETLIRDTRKTTPGLRELEKYAVRMGGGINHRFALSDAALIKDNHIEAVGNVGEAFERVRKRYPEIGIEIEVDTLEQLQEILLHRPDLVLLDNMSVEECRQAVAITGGRCKLEASGGLSLNNARAYAETGVDYLAVGALTHSAPVFDIGLDLKAEI